MITEMTVILIFGDHRASAWIWNLAEIIFSIPGFKYMENNTTVNVEIPT